MFVTNDVLNHRPEPNCITVTAERKYYHTRHTFNKRSVRTTERQLIPTKGVIHVPRQGRERILNEAAAMQYIADNTNIPIPKLHCCFEHDDAIYLVMEYIEGDTMNDLSEKYRRIVQEELDEHLETLHNLRS